MLYLFGDIQGCFAEFQTLLQHIQFNPKQDRLGFVGDLVNRGPQSLEVLRFIKNLGDSLVVLGNHDFYLLAIGYDAVEYTAHHTLHDILNAPDKMELLDWLRHQSLLYHDEKNNFVMTHAGIPPQWNVNEAEKHAKELETALRGKHFQNILQGIFGSTPACWSEHLTGTDRLRYITNAFTRMRFCDKNGCLELKEKREPSHAPHHFQPWFTWPHHIPEDIFFGHWAALEGKTNSANRYALDTGCAWGESLTCIRVEDRKIFSVPAQQNKQK